MSFIKKICTDNIDDLKIILADYGIGILEKYFTD